MQCKLQRGNGTGHHTINMTTKISTPSCLFPFTTRGRLNQTEHTKEIAEENKANHKAHTMHQAMSHA